MSAQRDHTAAHRAPGVTRRRLAAGTVGAAGALGGLFAAACAAPGSGQPGGTSTRNPVTLQYWSRWPDVRQQLEEKNLPVFMERSAPIRVERTGVTGTYEQLVEKVTTAFASGSAPDVFTMGSPDIVTFAHPGSALQLDTDARVRKEIPDFFDGPLAVGKYKDKLYGLTNFVDTRIMLYRKDLLAEAGLPTVRAQLPKTWEPWRDTLKRLARWEGGQLTRIGFEIATTGDSLGLFLVLLAQQGKGVFTADGTKVAFDGPEGQRALQLLVDIVHRDGADSLQRPTLPTGVESLATPVVASKWANSVLSSNMERAGMSFKDTIVSDLTPEYSGKITASAYLGGTWIMASKATKDPGAAVELALFLTSGEHAIAMAEQTNSVPARKSAGTAAYLQHPTIRAFYDSLQSGWSVPQHPQYAQVRGKLNEVVRNALQQKTAVPAALQEAAAFSAGLLGR